MTTVTLSAAQTAALAAGGTLSIVGTPAAATTVPPPIVVDPGSGTNTTGGTFDFVYDKGVMNWAGDWDDQTHSKPNYASAIKGVDGSSASIGMPGGVPYEYWLPYPKSNTAGPASNGVNYSLAGKTKMIVAIRPTAPQMTAQVQFFKGAGTTDDIAFGNMLNIVQAKYGPAVPVVDQWNVYTVPLADFALGAQTWIYKFILQQQGAQQAWNIDHVGFGV